MSNALLTWATGPDDPRDRRQKQHSKDVAHVVNRAKMAGLKVDAEAAVTGRIMERAVDLDQYRRALAGNDETLNMVLTRIELGFVDKAVRIQRQFGSELS